MRQFPSVAATVVATCAIILGLLSLVPAGADALPGEQGAVAGLRCAPTGGVPLAVRPLTRLRDDPWGVDGEDPIIA